MKIKLLLFLACATLARAANYIGDQTFAAPFSANETVNIVRNLTFSKPGTYTATSWNVVGLVRFAAPGEYFFVATAGGIAGSGNVLGPASGVARVHVAYRTSVNFVGLVAASITLIDDSQTTLPPPPSETVNPPPPAPLMNLSTRATIAAGGNLSVGFVVGGTTPRRVLVRAIGPGLAQFGLGGTLANPVLTVFSGTLPLATNDDWDDSGNLRATFAAVGAFGLAQGSADAAVIVTLQPGAYTAGVRGGSTADAGEVLVEIYLLE